MTPALIKIDYPHNRAATAQQLRNSNISKKVQTTQTNQKTNQTKTLIDYPRTKKLKTLEW